MGDLGNGLVVCACDSPTGFNSWSFVEAGVTPISLSAQFGTSPGTSVYLEEKTGLTQANDEIHFAVIDRQGQFAGYKNAIVEVFEGLSKCPEAKNTEGRSIFYPNYIRENSRFVSYLNRIPGILHTSIGSVSSSNAFGSCLLYTSDAADD